MDLALELDLLVIVVRTVPLSKSRFAPSKDQRMIRAVAYDLTVDSGSE